MPCQRAVPHLTRLQKEFPDLVVIGISDEEPSVVRNFVQKQGDRMDYRVAIDSRKETWRGWAEAAGVNGIPAAFMIGKDKKVAYVGNPHDPKFDKTLKAVASGRYDPKLMEEAQPLLKQIDYSRTMRDWNFCYKHLDELIAKSPRVFLDEAMLRFRIQALEQRQPEEAQEFARGQFSVWYADDAEALAALAKLILTDATLLRSDEDGMRELSVELAQASYARASSDPEAMSTLAMALYHTGSYDEAVRLARKAYLTADPNRKEPYKRQLDNYVRGLQAGRGG